MKIFNAAQIKAWDDFTIKNEPIPSIDLMERAAKKCVQWIELQKLSNSNFKIFCGKGNNGGDGLAIARLLTQKRYAVQVYILEFGNIGTDDFQLNLQRLHDLPVHIHFIQSTEHFPSFDEEDIIIDAMFGSGLNKPLEGLSAALVTHLNQSHKKIISVDIPTGLYMDRSSKGNTVVKANHTLSFQILKQAFLVAENEEFIGNVHVLNIGLHPKFLEEERSNKNIVDRNFIKSIFKKRKQFAHKGNFGHCLIIAGSYGKTGAAVLATKASLRSGAGLVTAFIPASSYNIMQTTVPEAMVITSKEENFIADLPGDIKKYNAVGIGPGIGVNAKTEESLLSFLKNYNQPLIIDADGLNCLANKKELSVLPSQSILTPHPKEFDRLFGEHNTDFDRIETSIKKASEFNIIIVLKGQHTVIASPKAEIFFNATGNAGMATAGSGDVLTGIITSFLGQGYTSVQAAILGVYIHGLAGDTAAKFLSQEAMIASDIIKFLPNAFLELNTEEEALSPDIYTA